MARKYVRDNRGRFASTGATARGGRLKTASGKKRETVTQKIKTGKPGGTVGKPRGLQPGAVTARVAARQKPTTPALTSRGKARAKPQEIAQKPTRMKPLNLKGAGKSLQNNLKAWKGLPVIVRSRAEAASAQREKTRRVYEYAKSSKAGMSTKNRTGSLKFRKDTIMQGNLLTGGVNKITRLSRPTFGDSKIGQSRVFAKNQTRLARAENRYGQLVAAERNLPRVRRGNAGSKIQQSKTILSRAMSVYNQGTGRKPPRRSTGRYWIKPR